MDRAARAASQLDNAVQLVLRFRLWEVNFGRRDHIWSLFAFIVFPGVVWVSGYVISDMCFLAGCFEIFGYRVHSSKNLQGNVHVFRHGGKTFQVAV